MAECTLDTSGDVMMPRAFFHPLKGGEAPLGWSDLTPFTRGYVEAAQRDQPLIRVDRDTGTETPWRFSDLAPETLATMLRDCAEAPDFEVGPGVTGQSAGAHFWRNRQGGLHSNFPPPTLYLGDDGKVYLREGAQ